MKRYNYIYKITNRVNGKIYIGKHSTNRLNDGYMGSGAIIKQAIKKYGKDNFSKFILCLCHDEESLNIAEINYISDYDSRNKNVGYNLTYGGDGSLGVRTWKGKHHTEETRCKISEALKGDKNPLYGKHHTEETRKKMSESHKGDKHPFYGKHHTDETRRKMMKPKPKYKWITPDGSIREMDILNRNKHHPDWVLIQETNNI